MAACDSHNFADRVADYVDRALSPRGPLGILGPLPPADTVTLADIASTNPNGHAPCRKPYREPSAHATANARLRTV